MNKESARDAVDASGGEEKLARAKDPMVALGARILQLRKRRWWSQGELAERLGVTRERVGNWERGENAPPLEALIGLAEVLRVSLDDLMRGKRRGRWLTEEQDRRLEGFFSELYG